MSADGLEKRVERLEAEVSDIKDTLSEVKQSQARAQVILEGIADSVERLVDGRGTFRCIEHSNGLAEVRKDLDRCSSDKLQRIGRVEGEFMAFQKEVKAMFERGKARLEILDAVANDYKSRHIAARVDAQDKYRDAMKNKLIGIGIACSVFGAVAVPAVKFIFSALAGQ